MTSAAPSVLLIADTENAARVASRAIEASAANVSTMLSSLLAIEDLTARPRPDAVWIELSTIGGLDRVSWLDWVRQALERGDIAVTIAMPVELIDAVDAEFGHTAATPLVAPDEAERLAALAIALNRDSVAALRDVRRDRELFRLRRLADELGRIARALSSPDADTPVPLTGSATQVADRQLGFAAEPETAPPLPAAEEVRRVIRMRRMRSSFFDAELFADPAWDMLLDLFAASIEGTQVAVSSLCIAAEVPHTTALRWIKSMTTSGLFERQADPADARRIFIRLADAPTNAMAKYFADVRRFESVSI